MKKMRNVFCIKYILAFMINFFNGIKEHGSEPTLTKIITQRQKLSYIAVAKVFSHHPCDR